MKRVLFVLFLVFVNIGLLSSLTGFAETPAFTINDETLPVTLSSFMAISNSSDNNIAINWVTESESNLAGYHIFRAESNSLATATKITFNIISANNSQLQSNYIFNDDIVEEDVTYYYWLEILEYNSSDYFGPVSAMIESTEDNNAIEEIVLGNDLYTNYPNPFNPSTTISYSLAEPGNVVVDIYNMKGQKINRLFSGYVQEVNTKLNIVWNGNDTEGEKVTSGIYFARIKTESFTKTTKMLLTK